MRRAALITGLAGLAVVALTWARDRDGARAAGDAAAPSPSVPRRRPRLGRPQRWSCRACRPRARSWWSSRWWPLALRVPAWMAPPAHSDDVYRYLWDGKVQRAGINPYRFAPDAVELTALRDADWARINNRQLPTIYPPLAEAAFAAAPSLGAWKLLVALADLAVALLLLCRARRPAASGAVGLVAAGGDGAGDERARRRARRRAARRRATRLAAEAGDRSRECWSPPRRRSSCCRSSRWSACARRRRIAGGGARRRRRGAAVRGGGCRAWPAASVNTAGAGAATTAPSRCSTPAPSGWSRTRALRGATTWPTRRGWRAW